MKKIERLTKKEFQSLIGNKKPIGNASSESVVYKLDNDIILKDLKDESLLEFMSPEDMIYTEEQLLSFADVKSKGYYFVKGIIYVDDELEACTMKRCYGYVLNYIDSLSINLLNLITGIDVFNKETLYISKQHIKGFDMQSNFMYDGLRFGAIDTIHYYRSDECEDKIYNFNINCFNDEVASFLVDLYFNEFVKQNKELNETYIAVKKGDLNNLNEFISIFRRKLSEYCGKNITYLSEAKDVIKENNNPIYPGCPIYSLSKK